MSPLHGARVRGILGDQSSRMRVDRRGQQPPGAAIYAYEDGHRDVYRIRISEAQDGSEAQDTILCLKDELSQVAFFGNWLSAA